MRRRLRQARGPGSATGRARCGLGFCSAWFCAWGGGQERGGQLLVEPEKVLDALTVGMESIGAVTLLHRPVEGGVRFH